MKKTIIISCQLLLTLSLLTSSCISVNDTDKAELDVKKQDAETVLNIESKVEGPVMSNMGKSFYSDFIYDIGTRFNPIKKSDLNNMRSFNEIIGDKHANRIEKFESVRIYLMKNDKRSKTHVDGTSHQFNKKQLSYLQGLDYSTDFMIWADYIERNPESGQLQSEHWTPHLTIVPEKQAEYPAGKKELMTYLRDSMKEYLIYVDPDKLRPAKLIFTVTKNGAVENARLDRPSGYPDVDKKMIELIYTLPDAWEAAENINGEKVNQDLVVSFGLKGC